MTGTCHPIKTTLSEAESILGCVCQMGTGFEPMGLTTTDTANSEVTDPYSTA